MGSAGFAVKSVVVALEIFVFLLTVVVCHDARVVFYDTADGYLLTRDYCRETAEEFRDTADEDHHTAGEGKSRREHSATFCTLAENSPLFEE